MRIAQVSPLFERVPPEKYGGTERVVSYLTEKLIELGHDVTLYASGDSMTRAKLVSVCPRSLRLHYPGVDSTAYHYLLLERVLKDSDDFDVIHFHLDFLPYPFLRRKKVPNVSTLHGRLDLPELVPLYAEYREVPVVSISDSQRNPLPHLNWQGTVLHGLPRDLLGYREGRGNYLAFLGRISPEKGPARAIEIAETAGIPLKIAAKVDKGDYDYYKSVVKPLLHRSKYAELIGEIGETDKNEFLGNAYALLFPIDWPEPFGMVQIEAMACGTPVVAYPGGAVVEILQDGLTGFVVTTFEEAVAAVGKVAQLDRARIRLEFEKRFSSTRMALDYLAIYRRICESGIGVTDRSELFRGSRGRDYSAKGSVLRTGDLGAG